MRTKLWKLALGVVAAAAFSTSAVAQKSGGTLNFVVGSKIPSYDGHIESTFGMIHPIAPFYSLLIRVNPANPSDPTDFECDLCDRTGWPGAPDHQGRDPEPDQSAPGMRVSSPLPKGNRWVQDQHARVSRSEARSLGGLYGGLRQ